MAARNEAARRLARCGVIFPRIRAGAIRAAACQASAGVASSAPATSGLTGRSLRRRGGDAGRYRDDTDQADNRAKTRAPEPNATKHHATRLNPELTSRSRAALTSVA